MKRLLVMLLCLLLLGGTACAQRLTDDELIRYYEESVYVGDSLGEMLRFYVNGVVRKAHPTYFQSLKFFTAHGYRLETAAMSYPTHDDTNIMYKGNAIAVGKLMSKLTPRNVFILAGLRDRIGDDIPTGMTYIENIVKMISEASPDTRIHFISLTPISAEVEKKAPGRQAKWDAYNAELEKKCDELGVFFINIAPSLKDENGFLAPKLATEDGYHLNNDGNAIWVQLLLDFAQTQYENGCWTPAVQEP